MKKTKSTKDLRTNIELQYIIAKALYEAAPDTNNRTTLSTLSKNTKISKDKLLQVLRWFTDQQIIIISEHDKKAIYRIQNPSFSSHLEFLAKEANERKIRDEHLKHTKLLTYATVGLMLGTIGLVTATIFLAVATSSMDESNQEIARAARVQLDELITPQVYFDVSGSKLADVSWAEDAVMASSFQDDSSVQFIIANYGQKPIQLDQITYSAPCDKVEEFGWYPILFASDNEPLLPFDSVTFTIPKLPINRIEEYQLEGCIFNFTLHLASHDYQVSDLLTAWPAHQFRRMPWDPFIITPNQTVIDFHEYKGYLTYVIREENQSKEEQKP